VLWSAQGACTIEIMTWLYENGSDFSRININGHSAFHKAAQRGNIVAVQWLASNFLSEKITCRVFICPDGEGNCPSDLCGIEGYDNLAGWISAKEIDFAIQRIRSATSIEDLLENYSTEIPSWLLPDLLEVTACKTNDTNAIRTSWGAGCGVRRMALFAVEYLTKDIAQKRQLKELVNDFNGID
jgi:hypothetical protein